MIGFFRKIKTSSTELDAVQTNVGALLNKIIKIDHLDGAFVDVEFTASALTAQVGHRLLRKPLGWIVVDVDAAITVYRNAWDSATITLTSSGAANVRLWVY